MKRHALGSAATASQRSFTTHEVARLVELPPRRLRQMARQGLVARRPGELGPFRYSFHDLVLLRNLRPLDATLPKSKTVRLLCDLKRRLQPERPLHTLRFAAWGKRLVVHEPQRTWDAETGQVLIDFKPPLAPPDRPAQVVRPRFRPPAEASTGTRHRTEELFDLACRLEEDQQPEAARATYLEILEEDPEHADSHLNLGRLLHESGALEDAVDRYRKALELRPDDAIAGFNLGVVYHDMGRLSEAAESYQRALAIDDSFADAHYNLSFVHRQMGDEVTALRHLKAYRWLTEGR